MLAGAPLASSSSRVPLWLLLLLLAEGVGAGRAMNPNSIIVNKRTARQSRRTGSEKRAIIYLAALACCLRRPASLWYYVCLLRP